MSFISNKSFGNHHFSHVIDFPLIDQMGKGKFMAILCDKIKTGGQQLRGKKANRANYF